MCGIIAYSGGVKESQLIKSIKILSHRGPDDSGYKLHGNDGFGHTRLAIQDLSANGSQPMTDKKNNVSIIFNGEIYNVNELRKNLQSSSHHFISTSDTEVILQLYIKYKEKLLEKIDGIYSFVIWDHSKNIFFIARDPLGIKPLYYYCQNNKFICSSEIKAIITDKDVSKSLNFKAITSHMIYLWSPNPHTMFSSISKLEPGSALVVKNGKILKKWSFYNLNFNHNNSYQNKIVDPVNELKELLFSSVKKQLISDVPIGSFLSGGVDSSAIAALVKIVQPDIKLKTFSINIEGISSKEDGMSNDLPYAKFMADYLGYDLNIINVNSSIISHLDKMIYHLDEPTADPAALNTMMISKIAKENGIKVLLSGTGGDDLFSGYRRHTALMSEKYWKWLPDSVIHQIPKMISKIPNYNNSVRRIKKALEYIDLNENERINSYFYWMNPENLNDIFSKSYKREFIASSVTSLIPDASEEFDKYHPLNKMLYIEMRHFLADHNLNYTDKMGMSEGVEIRVPLLDKDIVNFALNLPIHYKYNSSTKWIFKEALKGIVPRKILHRKKAGFGAPLRYWLKNDLDEVVKDTLSKKSINNRGIFNYDGVYKLMNNNNIDSSYTIFSMICMELWFRRFVD